MAYFIHNIVIVYEYTTIRSMRYSFVHAVFAYIYTGYYRMPRYMHNISYITHRLTAKRRVKKKKLPKTDNYYTYERRTFIVRIPGILSSSLYTAITYCPGFLSANTIYYYNIILGIHSERPLHTHL